MKVTIELSDSEAKRLRSQAARLGVPAEELARATVSDLLRRPPQDFESAAEHVLRKNEELYRRLA